MTRADFGRATEARFLLDAHRHGLLVSRPFDSAPGYDAIVDTGSKLLRVQIKGATAHAAGSRTRYCVNTNRKMRRGMKFDWVAVWLEGDGRWTFLPASVRRKKTVYIFPHGKHAKRGWEVFCSRRRRS